MITGFVIRLLVLFNGYWFGYMVTGLVIWLLVCYMVTGLFIWLLAWLYGDWFDYMITGLVIWLLVWVHGYRFGYMVTGLVIWSFF